MSPARRSRGATPGPDLFTSAERRERASGAPEVEQPKKSEPRIWSVGALTHAIAGALKGLGRVAVEGEVSQIKRAASGHVYFALKDDGGVVSCAIWRSRVQQAMRGIDLREGDKVVCHGALDVYAPRGTYSLLVDRVEARGIGALLAELEKLKAKLRSEGWFERSRPLPAMPQRVGVVTSRDTAAFQDFLRTRTRRWPLYPVRLAHAPVQGRGAAEKIADAIRRLDASGVDVMCVCRGGGSLEDLWAFNELPVAKAIHECSVPVVVGVGHETDVTLADFVADHRAHTPTDAASLVLPERRAIEDQLERASAYLAGAIESQLERRELRLSQLARARVLRDAEWITGDRAAALERARSGLKRALAQRFDGAEARLRQVGAKLRGVRPSARLERQEAALARLELRLRTAAEKRLAAGEQRLELAERSLRSISPFAVLERGYSITLDESGRAVRSAEDAALVPGARLKTKIGRGEIDSVIEAVRTDEDE